MHAEDVELNLRALRRRIQLGDRAERGGPGVGAQDRDLPAGQLVGERGPGLRVGEIHGANLDVDAVLLGQPRGQLGEHVAAARGDDQVVPAGSEFGGQRFADALRGTGDDGSTVRGGCGYWHAAIVGGVVMVAA